MKSSFSSDKPVAGQRAFTLLELLTVIAIIGILAAITLPNLRSFKPSAMAAATRQLLDDVARARQKAISQRTTVFMVFVPTNFWMYPQFTALPPAEKNTAIAELHEKQAIAYNMVSLRTLGDQPGQPTPAYLLREWKLLPPGVFILPQKFGPPNPAQPLLITNLSTGFIYRADAMNWTDTIPFPDEDTLQDRPTDQRIYVPLHYIGFNHLGQMVNAAGQPTGKNEVIPLALGSVSIPKNSQGPPSFTENPPGNGVSSFNLITIDWVTGRARAERQEIR